MKKNIIILFVFCVGALQACEEPPHYQSYTEAERLLVTCFISDPTQQGISGRDLTVRGVLNQRDSIGLGDAYWRERYFFRPQWYPKQTYANLVWGDDRSQYRPHGYQGSTALSDIFYDAIMQRDFEKLVRILRNFKQNFTIDFARNFILNFNHKGETILQLLANTVGCSVSIIEQLLSFLINPTEKFDYILYGYFGNNALLYAYNSGNTESFEFLRDLLAELLET